MKLRTRNALVIALFFALLGFSSFIAFSYAMKYNAMKALFDASTYVSTQRTIVRYATAVEIDAKKGTLLIRYPDPFDPSSAQRELVVQTGPGTSILRQESIMDERGVYVAVTEPVAGRLEDIRPGTRLRIHSMGPQARTIQAQLIVYGSPL